MNARYSPKKRISLNVLQHLLEKAEALDALKTVDDEAISNGERVNKKDIGTLAEALEELRIYHAELEIQNIELQQALENIDLVKGHYQALFNDNPLPSFVLDKKGVIKELNNASLNFLKLLSPLHRSYSLYRFLDEESGRLLAEFLNHVTQERFSQFTLRFVLPDTISFDCVLTRLVTNESASFLLIMRDLEVESVLEHEREIFRRVVDTCSDAIFVIDSEFNLVASNHVAEQFLGFTTDVSLPVRIKQALPLDVVNVVEKYIRSGECHAQHASFNFKSRDPHKINLRTDYYCRVFVADATDKNNELFGIMFTDNTELLNSQLQLDLAEQIFKETVQGIMITSGDGSILYANKAFEQITGFAKSEVIGKDPSILSSGLHRADFYNQFWTALLKQGHWQGEIWNRRKSGETYPQWLTVNRVDFSDEEHRYIALFSDITEQKAVEKQIKSLAYSDQLTGVGNRNSLLEWLTENIANKPEKDFGLMFLDLDYFKNVNDAHGHDVGDVLLKQVVHRVRTVVRAEDKLFRIGGDEFVIVFNQITPTQMASRAHQINTLIDAPFDTKGRQLFISCSIGIAFYPTDAKTSDGLLKHADIAMYKAKMLGRNRFQFFDESLSAEVARRVLIEQRLKHAIANEQLTFAVQTLHDFETGEVVSRELLVRWNNSGISCLSTEEFISIAEEDSSVIMSIDKLAVKTALEIIDMERRQGKALRIGVNLSDHDFLDKNNFESLLELCRASPESAAFLDIEVTERAVMRELEVRIMQFKALRNFGVRVLIDDFGTGYSSFSYLMQYPIDGLKIDYSFIWNMETNPNAMAIVKTIIELSHNLGLEVVAEGVETGEQAKILKRLGCHVAQGYYYARPQVMSLDGLKQKNG